MVLRLHMRSRVLNTGAGEDVDARVMQDKDVCLARTYRFRQVRLRGDAWYFSQWVEGVYNFGFHYQYTRHQPSTYRYLIILLS